MTRSAHSPEITRFLEQFFGDGNRLRWKTLEDGSMPEETRHSLEPWIRVFQQGGSPKLLPRVKVDEPSNTEWYAFADNAREARALREQLTAFIGPTYSGFDGQQAHLEESDPVDSACREAFGAFTYRLPVPNNEDRQTVSSRLVRMREFQERRPVHSKQPQRPIGRILRDLDLALIANNRVTAEACRSELRQCGRLSAINLRFVEVRILASFEEWDEILKLPRRQDLLNVQRPQRITEAFARAFYISQFSEFEETGDTTGCVERFRKQQGQFCTLFRTRGTIRDPVALKAFLLHAVASQSPLLDKATEIAGHFDASHPDRGWVEALLRSTQQSPPERVDAGSTPYDQARVALDQADYDGAFELFAQCDPSISVVLSLLPCAVNIGTLKAARIAVDYFASAPSDIQQEVSKRTEYQRQLDELQSKLTPSDSEDPDNWLEWIALLDDEHTCLQAREIARVGSTDWALEDFLSQPQAVCDFAESLLRTRDSQATEVLRNVVPTLIDFFLPASGSVRTANPVYRSLMDLLIYDEQLSTDSLTTFERLVEALLQHAERQETFIDVQDACASAWHQVEAPYALDWALDCIDLLIDTGATRHVDVTVFFNAVVDSIRRWPRRRISEEQREFLSLLASDLQLQDALTDLWDTDAAETDTSATDLREVLHGMSVAIYSLTERIARRTSQLIEQAFSGVTIHLCHDKASSDRLRGLAKSSDVFIINTWDAKHAATNAINDIRTTQDTLRPSSKSASAMFRCLQDFASKVATT
jgi:hypothetical protein